MTERTCAVEDCPKTVLARGWCSMHYERWRRHGDPLRTNKQLPKFCSIEGCSRPHLARGWCTLHYGRWKKYGDPATEPPEKARLVCSIEDCEREARSRGWCTKHYAAWKRTGDATKTRRPTVVCGVDGCEALATGGRGWCPKHYRRWQRHGNVDATSRIVGDDIARFWSYVDKNGPTPEARPDLGSCWIWTGGLSEDGYATMGINGTTGYMARWSYEQFVAQIPTGYEPDHLCRNRACVNFEGHLEPVTHRENVLRGESFAAANARKTHCPQGHEYTEANTIRQKRGGRLCRACQAEYDANRRDAV